MADSEVIISLKGGEIEMIQTLSKNKYKIIVDVGTKADRRRKSQIHIGTKREAQMIEFEMKQKYSKNSTKINITDITFKEYGNIFVSKYCEPNLSIKTIVGYKSMLDKINDYIGNWKLKDIDTYTLNELYIKLKNGDKVKKRSNYTILHYYNLINLMFEQAIDFEILDYNPNRKIKRPKKEKKLVQCYDMEQMKTLLNGLDNECLKYQALIRLAIDSGARKSEILALTWQDINFDTGVITINKSIDVIKGEFYEKELKNNSSYRNLVLTSKTLEVLKQYQEELKANTKGFKDSNKLFLARSGKPMYPTTCGKILQKVANKYNLPRINFHALRHTSASMLIALGVHPKEIQDRLGHSSMNVTMSIYSHIFQANRKEVANKLQTIF